MLDLNYFPHTQNPQLKDRKCKKFLEKPPNAQKGMKQKGNGS